MLHIAISFMSQEMIGFSLSLSLNRCLAPLELSHIRLCAVKMQTNNARRRRQYCCWIEKVRARENTRMINGFNDFISFSVHNWVWLAYFSAAIAPSKYTCFFISFDSCERNISKIRKHKTIFRDDKSVKHLAVYSQNLFWCILKHKYGFRL